MKKTLFVILVFSIAVTGLQAQQAGQFTLGSRIGWTIGFNNPQTFGDFLIPFMTLPSNVSVSSGNSTNFNFAVFGYYSITDRFSVQSELNFMFNQGYDLRFSAPGYRSRLVDVAYTSLDIPILVRYHLLNSAAIFGIQAGPHISIPLGRIHVTESWRTQSYEERLSDEFAIDSIASFGLSTGIFAGFPVRRGRIVIDLRFIFDFNSMEAYEWGVSSEFMRRRALAISVGHQRSF